MGSFLKSFRGDKQTSGDGEIGNEQLEGRDRKRQRASEAQRSGESPAVTRRAETLAQGSPG
ncbi:hypothetical protein D8T38_18270 [Vibrio vulnificus]|nr:hypothetical protein D8T38_18270 [Vibrio vulnificus]